jgi:hypothetical protein
VIGFIGTSVTISLNYNQYSVIADLHTFQFTVAHALGFSVSTSRLLATDLNNGYVFTVSTLSVSWQRILTHERSLQITMKSSSTQFSSANSLSQIRCMTGISRSEFSTAVCRCIPILLTPGPCSFKLVSLHRRGTDNACHVIATRCCGVTLLCMHKLNGHKESTAAVLLRDVTAYVEMFTEPLPRNGLHNPVLVLRACIT